MISNKARKGQLLAQRVAVFLLALGMIACSSGLDLKSRVIPDILIDLGNKAKNESDKFIGAMTYANLAAASVSGRGYGFQENFEDIAKALDDFLQLPKKHSFMKTPKDHLVNRVESLRAKLNDDIKPHLADADKSRTAARAAVVAISEYVKEGGPLSVAAKDLTSYCEATAALSECQALADTIVKNAESLYRLAALYSSLIPQRDAILLIRSIEDDLDKMRNRLIKDAIIIESEKVAKATSSFNQVSVGIASLEIFVKLMTQKDPVAADCLNETIGLSTKIAQLKSTYVDVAEPRGQSEAKSLFEIVQVKVKELRELFEIYTADEDFVKRSSGDKHLQILLKEAFSGAISAGARSKYALSDGQEVLRIRNALVKDRVVILKEDPFTFDLMMALAFNVIERKDPSIDKIDNLYLLNIEALHREARLFHMNKAQFNRFVIDQVRKAYLSKALGPNGARYNTATIIYRDKLDDSVDLSQLLGQFGDGMVIVVTKNIADIKKGTPLIAVGPNCEEAALIAEAVGRSELKENRRDDLVGISHAVAKGVTGLSVSSVTNITKAMKGIIARLPEHRINEYEISEMVEEELSDQGVARGELESSGILRMSLPAVKAVLAKNRNYFKSQSRGGLNPIIAEIMREQLEQAKIANKAAQKRAQDSEILDKAAIEKKKFADALAGVRDVLEAKKNALETALDIATDIKVKEITNAISAIKQVAQHCGSNVAGDMASIIKDSGPISPFIAKFPVDTRLSMWNLRLDAAAVVGTPEHAVLHGIIVNPKMTPADATFASCFLHKENDRNKILKGLQHIETSLRNGLNDLVKGTKNCLVTTRNTDECVRKFVVAFEHKRHDLVDGPKSDLQTTIDVSRFGSYLAHSKKNREFWYNKAVPGFAGWLARPAAGVGVFAAKPVSTEQFGPTDPSALGTFLADNTKTVPHSFAASILNRHYYTKALLEIIGTKDGMAQILPDPDPETDINALLAGGAGVLPKEIFLLPLLQGFDDNKAIAIRSRRVVNDHYHLVLQYSMAKLLYDSIVNLQSVINSFWDMKAEKLALFDKNDVWMALETLAAKIDDLSAAMNADFVQACDGGFGPDGVADTTALFVVGKVYKDLHSEVEKVHAAIRGLEKVSPQAVLSIPFTTKVTNWLNANSIGGIPSDDMATGWGPAPKGSIAQKFREFFESAYDVHVFTYLNMNGASVMAAPVGYKSWQATQGRGVIPLALGSPIQHPLEL